MKIMPLLLTICLMLSFACSKYDNKINLMPQRNHVISKSQPKVTNSERIHYFELLINYVDNKTSKLPQTGQFCGIEADNGNIWACANAFVANSNNPSSANFDIEYTGLVAKRFYYIIPPGNYPKDLIKIRFLEIGSTPSPDTYFNYYKDSKTFELIKLGYLVESSVIRFQSDPFYHMNNQ